MTTGEPAMNFERLSRRPEALIPMVIETTNRGERAFDIYSRLLKTLNDILAEHTGQPIEKIERDTERDFFMSAEEAKGYGIIDDIILSTARPGDVAAAAKDGRLELSTAGSGRPEPHPEPEREGPKTSR